MQRKSRKRPCRICGKWFSPNTRVGERQKTCGAKECQREWHAKKCSEWNKSHPVYFKEIYLSQKLTDADPHNGEIAAHSVDPPAKSSQLPLTVIQEVITPQQLVIIEYVNRLLLRSFKEVMVRQIAEIIKKQEQLLSSSSSRGDSRHRGS
jgi:hypothetical protein